MYSRVDDFLDPGNWVNSHAHDANVQMKVLLCEY